jgi:hypothetical protein
MFLLKTFKQRSESIISTFTKVVNDLTNLNAEILETNQELVEELINLNRQIDDNDKLLAKNRSIINKIEKLISND